MLAEESPSYFEFNSPFPYMLMPADVLEAGRARLLAITHNVRGEPMVLTPEEVYRCFTQTEMDFLGLEVTSSVTAISPGRIEPTPALAMESPD